MALFFNGQCHLADTFLVTLATRCDIQFDSGVKAMKIKLNGRGWFPHGHLILQFLPLIVHNLLLVYHRFEYNGNF